MIRQSTQKIISMFIYLLINCLFVFKYSSRFFNYPIVLVAIYICGVLAFIFLIEKEIIPIIKIFNSLSFLILFLTSIFILTLILITDDWNIRVGRYQAINSWIENFLSGKFPYGNQDYHNPSSFPFLFLILIPLYKIGNVGLFQLISFLVFSYLLYRKENQNKKQIALGFGLLILAPIFWYEVITRSELFSNMVLLIALLYFAQTVKEKIKLSFNIFTFIAIISGLLLSTRSIVLMILILFFTYTFRNNLPKLILYFLIVAITFLITIVPFYIWDPIKFIEKGPFTIQSMYLHPVFVGMFLLASFFIGWKSKNEKYIHFKIALLLFLIIISSFIQNLFNHTMNELIFMDRFDVAYFIFPLPFLLFTIHSE